MAIAGRNEEAVAEAARRYGFERARHRLARARRRRRASGCSTTSGPNDLHAEPTIAAAEAGKHVICEKPLGRDADECYETWQRVAAAGVKHMCAFNYRFVPAVRLAREMIEAGEIGEIRHFRGRLPAGLGHDRPSDGLALRQGDAAGSGALGDLGAHVIDLARYLVGEIATVSAPDRDVPARAARSTTRSRRPSAFANGAVGTIEATRFATGRKNALRWEINGSKGSIAFDLERLNELQVHSRPTPGAPARASGPCW